MDLSQIFSAILLRRKEKISIQELAASFKQDAFPLLFLILALPSALPVPAVGYALPFGCALFLLAFQNLRNHPQPYLPRFIQTYKIPVTVIRKALTPLLLISGFLKKNFPQNQPSLHKGSTFSVALLSIIMMIPIPFTNTIPALGIVLLALAMIHNNQTIVRITNIIACFIILVYVVLFYLAYVLGSTLITTLFHTT